MSFRIGLKTDDAMFTDYWLQTKNWNVKPCHLALGDFDFHVALNIFKAQFSIIATQIMIKL